mmetsp:Transcript_14425/g.2365  ORF Transcript_14425/g.2365 Transcript_14425/m.2365 type:complete len:85 (-) Transcript_14425:249-503(-)
MEESMAATVTVEVILSLKIDDATTAVGAGISLVYAQTVVKDTQEVVVLDEKPQIADLPNIEEVLLIEGREGQQGPAIVAVVTKM